MYIQQIYTACLAEASYYIESNGEAIVIDPIRDTDPYIVLANERNAKITYIFETHFHADFVSGHIELSRLTEAKIIFGPNARTLYSIISATDGQIFQVGDLQIKALHTPGHTPESTCYLLLSNEGREEAIFTGDTLFIGEVGRPDLAVSKDISKEELASSLYDSLHNVLLKLPDHVKVYPAHGAGSACGKNISSETESTIGLQKQYNYALQQMTKNEFIKTVLDGMSNPPKYFSHDVSLNQNGYDSASNIIINSLNFLSISEIEKERIKGATILDVRMPQDFENFFIPNSINIGKTGMFAPWVGTLIHPVKPIVIICYVGEEKEVISRLTRIGYHNVIGYAHLETDTLQSEKLDRIVSIYSNDITINNSRLTKFLDVRRIDEFERGHVSNAIHIPLDDLQIRLKELNQNTHYLIYCAGGYRSMIAASLCKLEGYNNIKNIYGGFNSIIQSNSVSIV